jgi:predicted amidohydrolase YtcJ
MSQIEFPTAEADLVFMNGKIVTVNSNDDVAEALSIRHNRILRVGARAYVEQ